MKLPTPPEPAMVYINATGESTRCHNETQLIEYGRQCAEAMREACAAECETEAWRLKKIAVDTQSSATNMKSLGASDCVDKIRALEIE